MKKLQKQVRLTLTVARNISLMSAVLLFALATNAQTTLFTFQNTLPNEITPATGTFEMEFKLFDAAAGGTQIGATNSISEVEVKTRSFTVWLDFGAAAFPGADRFIEVSVRRSGSSQPFTTISPRTPILSVPYAIRALNATTADNALNLGGVDVNDFVQTTDSRLSDNRDPNPGSSNYIQNTTTQQTGANFNISGSGTAGGTLSGNVVNAQTQYNLGGSRILSAPGTDNTFTGLGAGAANTTGDGNSFFGTNSGQANTEGRGNSFFGSDAGFRNTTGSRNTFIGSLAGFKNTTGLFNVFIGSAAGFESTTGLSNTFVGTNAGTQNTVGFNNSFFGANAGGQKTTGNDNAFFGGDAGAFTNTGNGNSYFGSRAGGANEINNAAAIGFRAFVTQSNSLVLGGISGVNGGVSTNVGIGTTAPADRLDVNGIIRVSTLGAAGGTNLCRNALNQISTCSSSLRYKINIAPFGFGLNLVNRLQPITFKWRDGGISDLGLGAEDVAAIEPLLVTYNASGEVEGVKYDRIGVVLLNAVKQQQAQIEKQNKQIEEQQLVIDDLKKLVCQTNRQAKVCK